MSEVCHELSVVFKNFSLLEGMEEVETPPDQIDKSYTEADQGSSENVLSASIGVSVKEPLASTDSCK